MEGTEEQDQEQDEGRMEEERLAHSAWEVRLMLSVYLNVLVVLLLLLRFSPLSLWKARHATPPQFGPCRHGQLYRGGLSVKTSD